MVAVDHSSGVSPGKTLGPSMGLGTVPIFEFLFQTPARAGLTLLLLGPVESEPKSDIKSGPGPGLKLASFGPGRAGAETNEPGPGPG